MTDGTVMEFVYNGFNHDGSPTGNQAGAPIIPLEFKFDSFQIINETLKIVGVETRNGAIHVFDAEKCRVIKNIDKEASREAILG